MLMIARCTGPRRTVSMKTVPPVVTTDVRTIPDLIGDGGWLRGIPITTVRGYRGVRWTVTTFDSEAETSTCPRGVSTTESSVHTPESWLHVNVAAAGDMSPAVVTSAKTAALSATVAVCLVFMSAA
jgi:hypothetical protein